MKSIWKGVDFKKKKKKREYFDNEKKERRIGWGEAKCH